MPSIRLRNIPIAGKLMLPAAIILLSSLATLALQWWSVSALRTDMEITFSHRVPALRYILEAQRYFSDAAIAEKNIILDGTDLKTSDTDIATYKKQIDGVRKSLAVVRENTFSAENGKLADAFIAAVEARVRNTQDVIAASRAGDTPRARELSAVQGRAARLAALAASDALAGRLQTALLETAERMDDATDRMRWYGMLASLIGLTLSQVVLLRIGLWQIAMPVKALAGQLQRVGEGDLTITVAGTRRGDEIGLLARTLLTLRDNAERARSMEQAIAMAQTRERERHQTMERHARTFRESVSTVLDHLTTAAAGMRTAAGAMARSATETTGQAGQTASSARATADNLTATAASVEQMSASISEISVQIAHAAREARAAVERAHVTDDRIADLVTASGRIEGVVRLIAEVAGRTNLLALNASVEAARAGDAGKGFAVVAGEVKALAAQTAHATGEISGQIVTIQHTMKDAVAATRDAGGAVGRIDMIATAIAAAVEQQAAAIRDIVTRLHHVTAATGDVTAAMGDVTNTAEVSSAHCDTVLSASDAVVTASDTLRETVGWFLNVAAENAAAQAA